MIGCNVTSPISITKLYTFFKKKFNKDYFFRGEAHDFYEVVCAISGEVGITAGKDAFVLKGGEMTFHPPGEFHAIRDENSTEPEVIIFSFSATAFPEVSGKIFSVEDKLSEIIEIHDLVRSSFTCSDSYISCIEEEKQISAALAIKRLEIFLISTLCNEAGISVNSARQSSKLFSRILTVMNKNINSPLSVGEIAELCGSSVPTLEKTVYKYLGYGAMNHYNILRLQKSHAMLLEGISVKEVSLSLGFSNQNYFSSRFKKYFGYPPSKVGHKEGVSQ